MARVGPPSTYTRLGLGCAGSLPAARLVPLDTLRVGATFEVRLFDLTASSAILLTSVQTMSLGLGSFGLPECTLYVGVEIATPVSGAGGRDLRAADPQRASSGRLHPPPAGHRLRPRRRQPIGPGDVRCHDRDQRLYEELRSVAPLQMRESRGPVMRLAFQVGRRSSAAVARSAGSRHATPVFLSLCVTRAAPSESPSEVWNQRKEP